MTKPTEAVLADALQLDADARAQIAAELHIHVGQRAEGVESAGNARKRACEVKDADESKWEQACSLAYEAWCHHIGGALKAAADRFAEADRIQRERSNHQPHLVDLWGIYHADHLRLMLRHLIANALEAMPEAGGTITLATSRDARGWILLEVRDTGRGMLPEVLERAMEPFFTTKAGRLGIGLNIANGIWRRHRGTLALRSQEGTGTQVRLSVEP